MLLRVLIWSVIFYFLARIIWRLVSSSSGPSEPGSQPKNATEAPPKSTEKFQDVRDAKFVDVPKSSPDDSSDEKDVE